MSKKVILNFKGEQHELTTGGPDEDESREAQKEDKWIVLYDEGGALEIQAPSSSIDEVVNKAAKHLPLGYSIRIEIEKEGYNVELLQPHSTTKTFDGEGIIDEINEAICWANGFYG